MEGEHLEYLERTFQDILDVYRKKIRVLDIPDRYAYRDPNLIEYLKNAVATDEAKVEAEKEAEPSKPLDDNF
jgi:predicted protein tyrosine phosphatase